MNEKAKAKFIDTEKRLADASRLNASDKYAEALTCAYKAAEGFAAAYLLDVMEQSYPDSAETFELFNKKIREPKRHPVLLQEIKETVGDVYVLRETYVPALLYETTQDDACLMIDKVSALKILIVKAIGFVG
jgi:hypothetical protein